MRGRGSGADFEWRGNTSLAQRPAAHRAASPLHAVHEAVPSAVSEPATKADE